AASNAFVRPSGASGRHRPVTVVDSGERIRLTPPASATSHSPARRLWHARWIAASDEEHAVSTVMPGPVRPNWYDTRFASMPRALPVPTWLLIPDRAASSERR